MLKKDLNKELKKLFTPKKTGMPKTSITPYRDWRMAVIVFFGGLLFSLGFSVYMFIEISRDSFFVTVPKGAEAVTLNRDGLSRALGGLVAKETLFEELKIKSVPVVDPSL